LGNPARRRQLKGLISEERLDGIGIQETIKKDFSVKELIGIARGFQWVWKDAVGHSGGILMGFKTDLFEMEDSEVGELYASMVVMIDGPRGEG
jgi:hypothetical protein